MGSSTSKTRRTAPTATMANSTPEITTTSRDTHPVLPNTCELAYLDEGAANIVYRVSVPPSTPEASSIEDYEAGTAPTEIEFEDSISHILEKKLLRLRKDLPTTAPCRIAQDSWERLIKPLLQPNEYVDQQLIRLSTGIIPPLNAELQEWEHSGGTQRPKKRCGDYLADDEYGLLVTDMTPELPGQYFVEFKPKWLLQSPTAPANAKRCRTCALAARTKARGKKGDVLKSPVCPLDLISSDPEDVRRAASLLLHSDSVRGDIARFERWLESTTLLHRLRDIQERLDTKGVLDADVEDGDILVAMTMRDCTVFVRFPQDPATDEWDVEARLGDLDLKSKGKEEYWRATERALIEEGWYEGAEKEEEKQAMTCQLSR